MTYASVTTCFYSGINLGLILVKWPGFELDVLQLKDTLEAVIRALHQRFGPQGWKLGHEAGIWVLSLGFGPQG